MRSWLSLLLLPVALPMLCAVVVRLLLLLCCSGGVSQGEGEAGDVPALLPRCLHYVHRLGVVTPLGL
jgi:hypothetical protein